MDIPTQIHPTPYRDVKAVDKTKNVLHTQQIAIDQD